MNIGQPAFEAICPAIATTDGAPQAASTLACEQRSYDLGRILAFSA